jgi:hypothetical protein
MGAPVGNQNARKGGWGDALRAAVEVEIDPATKRRKIHAIADKLVELAAAGEIQAIRELGDRLDGKPAQAIVHSGGMTYGHVLVPVEPRESDPLDKPAGTAAGSDT